MSAQNTISFPVIDKLLNPIPQYVLGTLPAIATIGASPKEGLTGKLLWMFRCLGCPFTGLFYFVNIENEPNAMCTYWLHSYQFTDGSGRPIPKPLGQHAMQIPFDRIFYNSPYDDELKQVQIIFKRCITDASVLDRLSSVVSAYYILVGISAAISRVSGPCSPQDWPYIPLLLAWTLPAIYVRIVKGRVAILDPSKQIEEEFGDNYRIPVIPLPTDELRNKTTHAMITAFFSLIIPPLAIIFAYFTPPIGYGCRSKYLTIICSTWTINTIIAIIYFFSGEKTIKNQMNTVDLFINGWFSLCGVIIASLLFILGLLTNTPQWWVSLFGPACDLSTCLN